MRSAFKAVLIGSCIAVLGGGMAMATGGAGGMGGGNMKNEPDRDYSSSGSRYDPATEYTKAIAALKANDYKAAASAAEHVTDAVPKNPDAWRLLGAAKAGANDWRGSR